MWARLILTNEKNAFFFGFIDECNCTRQHQSREPKVVIKAVISKSWSKPKSWPPSRVTKAVIGAVLKAVIQRSIYSVHTHKRRKKKGHEAKKRKVHRIVTAQTLSPSSWSWSWSSRSKSRQASSSGQHCGPRRVRQDSSPSRAGACRRRWSRAPTGRRHT